MKTISRSKGDLAVFGEIEALKNVGVVIRQRLKYKLLKEDTIKIGTYTLYRIQALKDFGDVREGDLGGYIQSEKNLSHNGKCWVADEAKVFENAKIFGNALVFGDALVSGYAWVFDYGKVYGRAQVFGDALIYESAEVCGYTMVFEFAEVFGSVKVVENALFGYAQVDNV